MVFPSVPSGRALFLSASEGDAADFQATHDGEVVVLSTDDQGSKFCSSTE